jgi:hypothetical protein
LAAATADLVMGVVALGEAGVERAEGGTGAGEDLELTGVAGEDLEGGETGNVFDDGGMTPGEDLEGRTRGGFTAALGRSLSPTEDEVEGGRPL